MVRTKAAFTLIELLVVIAIIAILAAILFPIFESAKSAGQTASCASNEHQIAVAVLAYVDDHQGWMVPCFTEPAYWDKGTAWTWRWAIQPYIRNKKVMGCPTIPVAARQWGVPQMVDGKDDIASTYGLNMNIAGNNSTIWQWGCKRITGLRRTTKTIMLLENAWGYFYPHYDDLGIKEYLFTYYPAIHNQQMNIAFLDGHVRLMALKGTISVEPQHFLWFDIAGSDATTISQVAKILRAWPRNYPPKGFYWPPGTRPE